jgi:ubiquinone/menaquinone biosynthesis C-methylase UbiE
LLPNYAVQLDVDTNHDINSMSFDKERVFRYYNSIEYEKMDDSVVYADAKKFVDFRDLTRGYLENSFLKIKQFIPENGFYFLDIASGPIGLKEYIDLSSGYEKRICIDISFNALVQAKYNYGTTRGIYICGDIANIPLKEGICDVTISQHTLYHVPKDEQKKAIEELYRVTKNNGTIAIVYSWFYHSMLMNITLLPVQLYRVTRHLAGKLYVRIWTQKPRLYFYPHGPFWFKNLGYGNNLKIYSWRSLNTQFMKVYIHKWLYGEKILTFFQKLEDSVHFP